MKDTEGRLLIVTGLSGSGKSYAAHALEDIGYVTVDNLPLSLLDAYATEVKAGRVARARNAVVLDVRNPDFAEVFPGLLEQLRRSVPTTLLFLECEDRVLLNRFSETRRPHPLATNRTLAEAVAFERRLLGEVKERADIVIDTSGMTVHELRSALAESFRDANDPGVLALSILSFGFKHGMPSALDLCFDVRFLANPHFDPRLRPRTGKDAEVARYIEAGEVTQKYYDRLLDFLSWCLPNYRKENRSYLTIAVGCTGGRHRSVYIAERLKRDLSSLGYPVRVLHRDENKEF
ncbi:MAG: RNase adapter RapZ [Acidobacteria bacterium]|nr:RNase adapter RapZ [Acidobacteriota bacterium]MCG3194302.1 Nucleotide-binding protein YvcJ [Thermoanaerobaculia bacterium]